jgi:hypothetical protein
MILGILRFALGRSRPQSAGLQLQCRHCVILVCHQGVEHLVSLETLSVRDNFGFGLHSSVPVSQHRALLLTNHFNEVCHFQYRLAVRRPRLKPDPRFANWLLEQFGGGNDELEAAMQYFLHAFDCKAKT